MVGGENIGCSQLFRLLFKEIIADVSGPILDILPLALLRIGLQNNDFETVLLGVPAAPLLVAIGLFAESIIHVQQIRTNVIALDQQLTEHYRVYSPAKTEDTFFPRK